MSDADLKTRWEQTHQPFELRYHQHSNFRWPGREALWDEQWNNVFGLFGGLNPESFTDNEVLLDVGCGSRPALQWFKHGLKYHTDPLLAEYLKIKQMQPHWENTDAEHLISAPAEECQEKLVDKCDFVLCWNVLDHTYDWREILHNCHAYLKQGGLFLLGTDHGGKEHIGHPGIPSSQVFLQVLNTLFIQEKSANRNAFKNCRTSAFLLRKR